jgi:hypothetical protein
VRSNGNSYKVFLSTVFALICQGLFEGQEGQQTTQYEGNFSSSGEQKNSIGEQPI